VCVQYVPVLEREINQRDSTPFFWLQDGSFDVTKKFLKESNATGLPKKGVLETGQRILY